VEIDQLAEPDDVETDAVLVPFTENVSVAPFRTGSPLAVAEQVKVTDWFSRGEEGDQVRVNAGVALMTVSVPFAKLNP
jgi:hypothetical protein